MEEKGGLGTIQKRAVQYALRKSILAKPTKVRPINDYFIKENAAMKKFLALVMAAVLLCSTFSFTFAETVTSCDNGHQFDEDTYEVVTDAKCTEKGLSKTYCTRCEKWIEDDIPAKGHVDADKPIEIKGENCGDTIVYVYAECDVCGEKNFTKEMGTIQHEYDKDTATNFKKVEPTCTEDGYTEYYCTRNGCGFPQRVPGDKALGHDWKIANDGMIDPTCYADGKSGQYIYCDRCKLHASDDFIDADGDGVKDDDELSVDAHVEEKLTHDATLTEWEVKNGLDFGANFDDLFFIDYIDGTFELTEYARTFDEGVTVLEDNEEYRWPLSHSGKVTVTYTKETCTTDGSFTVECSCGNYKRSETLKAYDHYYGLMDIQYVDAWGDVNTLEINYADFKAEYEKIYGAIKDYIDVFDLNLTPEKIKQVLYALDYVDQTWLMEDCTIRPLVNYICVKCHDRVDAQAAACKDHTFGTEKDLVKFLKGEATEGTVGRFIKVRQLQIPEYKGNDDNQIFEREDQLEVIVYDLEDFNAKIAKCTPFEYTVGCEHCAVTKTFTLSIKDAHQLPTSDEDANHYVVIRKSTCTVAGLRIRHCTDVNCGYSVAENLPLAPHQYDLTKTVVVAPSCEKDGSRTMYCKNCDYVKEEVVPSYGHDYEWQVTVEPGCKKEGEEKKICNRCGDEDGVRKLAEAHIIASWDDITAMTNVKVADIHAAATIANDKNGNMIGYNVPVIPWDDCTKDGNLQFVCINCKNVKITHKACEHDLEEVGEKIEVEKGTGKYEKWTFVDDNTCRLTIKVAYDCLDCNQVVEKVETYDYEHAWDGDFDTVYIPTTTAPTCKDTGMGFYKCVNCKDHFVDEIPAFNHSFYSVYNTEKGCWDYVCEWCGEVETVEYAAEKYTIDTSKIVWANKTSGTGYVERTEDLGHSFVLGARYAFIQWTWVTKNGDNVVADNVVELKYLEDGKYSFNAKGVSVAGATLDNVVIYITDDADAVDFSSTNYGATRMD